MEGNHLLQVGVGTPNEVMRVQLSWMVRGSNGEVHSVPFSFSILNSSSPRAPRQSTEDQVLCLLK